MIRRLALSTTLMAMLALSSACSTLADAQQSKGTGTTRVYQAPYDAVWDATLNAVNTSGLALVSERKTEGKILAQRGMTAFSYGENVAIFVESAPNQEGTRVEVVNKKSLAVNITAANWDSRIFKTLDAKFKK
jgi:hypothetical protein